RRELAEARDRKRTIERELAGRLAEKRKLAARLKAEIRGHRAKESALAREREALKRLLEGLDAELMGLDRRIRMGSVRRRKGRLHWPLPGRIVASFHSRVEGSRTRLNGVRIAPVGSDRKVRAMAAGQVRYADWFGGYGLMMIVDYGDGVLGVYAHNDALFRQVGDWVEAGEVIARAGSTGLVDRTRLYFEIRDRGRPVNPRLWCRR
ncbi:MAG: peptidoglycan DD-metalloendopeptidase family protein, partial [Mariprofundaceae bacterium]